MNTDKVYESKLKEVQAALKALYEFVDDYIHDDKNTSLEISSQYTIGKNPVIIDIPYFDTEVNRER